MKGHKIGLLLLLLLAIIDKGAAQQFAWKSNLDTVVKEGYYSIGLSPQWLALVKPDLADIRIKDQDGKTVPFISKQHSNKGEKLFVDFPILRNNTDSFFTTLELDAHAYYGTDHLLLLLGNTAVKRKASLSGSNDKSHWFIIKESLLLENDQAIADDHFIQVLSIPFNRYRYLKLQIENKGSDPLFVSKAGVYATALKEKVAAYYLKAAAFKRIDSVDGYSYVWVKQPASYPLEKINLHLSGAKFYAREGSVYKIENTKPNTLLTTTQLRSDKDAEFWLQAEKLKEFLIVIQNGENPPLKIDSIITQVRQQNLVAYFERGKRYTLFGGDAMLAAPNFDLALFQDSLPSFIPVLTHGALLPNAQSNVVVKESGRWWLWPSIATAILLMAFLTLQLVREVNKQQV